MLRLRAAIIQSPSQHEALSEGLSVACFLSVVLRMLRNWKWLGALKGSRAGGGNMGLEAQMFSGKACILLSLIAWLGSKCAPITMQLNIPRVRPKGALSGCQTPELRAFASCPAPRSLIARRLLLF